MGNVLIILNNILWLIVTLLLIISGLYFTFKLQGRQFNIRKMFKELLKKDDNKGVSSFGTLMLSLAGRIGVGSISGVALAIYLAGPGTIFWIWVISFLSAILGYVESYLGVKYKEIDCDNNYVGGPAYYIKKALKSPKLGSIYAIMIIICYCGGFMLIQANTITKAVTTIYNNVNPLFIGILLSIFTLIIIFGGIKKVTNTTSKIVPVMSFCYVAISVFVMITNIDIIPEIFKIIFKGAFTYKSFVGGFLVTMVLGIQRGIFSSEGGIGTGSMAAAISGSNDANSQGFIQMIGIYVTSFLICTSTAIIVLTSDYKFMKFVDLNGIELAIESFNYHLGDFGNIFLITAIFLFAFSTILSGYFYGETSLKYLFKNCQKRYLICLKLFTCLIIFLGTITASGVLWKLTDIFVATLALINVYALFKLRREIRK